MSKELKLGLGAFLVLMFCLYIFMLLSKANNTINKVDTVIEVIEDNVSKEDLQDGVKTTVIVVTEVADSTKSKILKFIRK